MSQSGCDHTSCVLYFVKYPEPGKVKTRLAKTLGFEKAAQIYRQLAEMNLRILTPLHKPDTLNVIIVFDPADRYEEMRAWLSAQYDYLPQKGADLGDRLRNAFRHAFKEGFHKVIAMGSDMLCLSPDLILQAFRRLDQDDVVIGPSRDGGYYLLGLLKETPSLFQNIPWSTSSVLTSTLAFIQEQRLSYSLLEELEDVDQVENLSIPVGR